MTTIALRAFTKKIEENKEEQTFHGTKRIIPLTHDRTLVFDTETTVDSLTFKVGYFRIRQDGKVQHRGFFYEPSTLSDDEKDCLSKYATKYDISLYLKQEFIDEVLYPELLNRKTLCMSYYLPFDLSRLKLRHGNSRNKFKGGFTFTLSEKPFFPPIIIKKINDFHLFKLTSCKWNTGVDYHAGYFVDVQRLADVMLDTRHIPLSKACDLFNTKTKKLKNIEHGIITPRYLNYLIADVEAAHEVYVKALEELAIYQIAIPPTKLYSAASLAKYMLRQLGIKPFREQNLDFPDEILGAIMTSYHGARNECKIRRRSINIDVLDFTNTYGTITLLARLWDMMIAEKIVIEDATEETIKEMERVTVEDLQDKNVFQTMNRLTQIRPVEDILPVRVNHTEKEHYFTSSVSHLSADFDMFYFLPDVAGSKILKGTPPKILKAIRFKPEGQQPNLKTTTILGIEINPYKDNPIKLLVEERHRIKKKLKEMDKKNPEYKLLSSREKAIKIIVNALCYGIYLELNPDTDTSTIEVYGLKKFLSKECFFENEGAYFNPIIASIITSGARLFLAIAEKLLADKKSTYAYMDTDAIFTSPNTSEDLITFFQKITPYDEDIPILKREPHKQNVLLLGIASKRYILYIIVKGKIYLLDLGGEPSFSLHGLAHLTNPYRNKKFNWLADLFLDIIKLHHKQITMNDINEKYANLYGLSKMSITTPKTLEIFEKMNEETEQKKPFDFFLVGFQTIKEDEFPVKPVAPYKDNPQLIIHEPFTDANTGKTKQGIKYFKSLSKTIMDYLSHKESKFEGTIGILKRKHIHATEVTYIGKEINNLDDEPLKETYPQEFGNKEDALNKIIRFVQENPRPKTIDKDSWKKFRKSIRQGNKTYLNTKVAREIMRILKSQESSG